MDAKQSFYELVIDKKGSTDDKIAYYNEWSKEFDKYMKNVNYQGPLLLAEAVENECRRCDVNISGMKLLDVLAGTGLVGKELQKRGFTNMDALDGSPGMLQIATDLGIYQKTMCVIIKPNESVPIDNDTYDLAVMSGGDGNGHFPCEGLYEILRILKSGCSFMMLARRFHLEQPEYKDKFEPLLEKMEQDGVCTVRRETLAEYHDGEPGLLFLLKKT